MGRKLNLSHLTDEECDQILRVVQLDSAVLDTENRRLSQIQTEVQEEDKKSDVLSKSQIFNEKNCIRCFSRFFFLFNSKRECSACRFYVCKKCCEFDFKILRPVCKACLKHRQLDRQSIDWFYSAVNKKFKHSGSIKVYRSIRRRSTLSNLEDGTSGQEISEFEFGMQPRRSQVSDAGPNEWARYVPLDINSPDSDRRDGDRGKNNNYMTALVDGDNSSWNTHRHSLSSPRMNPFNDVINSSTLQASALYDCLPNVMETSVQTDSNSDVTMSLTGGWGKDGREEMDVGAEGKEMPEVEDADRGKNRSARQRSDDLLRLAEGVTRSQGQMSTTASRMMRSADAMSSIYQELDEIDKKLDCLEGEVDDVTSSQVNQLGTMPEDDCLGLKFSAEAIGGVTSAALGLLANQPRELLYSCDDPDTGFTPVGSKPRRIRSSAYDGDLSSNIWTQSGYLREPLTVSESDSDDVIDWRSENALKKPRHKELSVGECEGFSGGECGSGGEGGRFASRGGNFGDVFSARGDGAGEWEGRQIDKRQETMRKDRCRHSSRSLEDLESPTLKDSEEMIYVASGRVFALEECVIDLEQQVLMLNEQTSEDALADLEQAVARAVASVERSDRQIDRVESMVQECQANQHT